MEELPVQLWKKRSLATLTNAQLTVKLKIGQSGLTAAQPAEEEPRREEEELFKPQRTEELSVQLWRKKNLATLTNAQLIAKLKIGPLGATVA